MEVQRSVIRVKHSMPGGDLLSLLPSFKNLFEVTGKRIIVYQRVNLRYGDMYGAYAGATYSIKDDENIPVTMNWQMFSALRKLLLFQEYIEDFLEWENQEVDYDLDLMRQADTTMPYGCINMWPQYIWPEMASDLSKEWLKPHWIQFDNLKDKILINRTERYNNMLISYKFLQKYGDNVLFIGLENEHQKFNQHNGIDIQRLSVKDFLDVYIAFKSCKLFIGSQSALFQIAEGAKIPRLLECCKQIPNVIGSGPGFYDFITQKGLEYHCEKLFNK